MTGRRMLPGAALVALLAMSLPTAGLAAPPDDPDDDGIADLLDDDIPDGVELPDPIADEADPTDPEPTAGAPSGSTAGSGRRQLVEVPQGCVVQPLPDVVFVGRVVDRDYRTARFRIGQVRAGDPSPFAADGLIDVRYGADVQYLGSGDEYLVAARRDPVLGVLESRIRPEPPMFGGDDIVGLVDAEVECPGFEDPVGTLRPDGAPVESSVVAPLFERRTQLVGALLLPVGVAFAMVFVLASLRMSIAGLVRGITGATRPRSARPH